MGRLRRIEEISEVVEFDCGDAALNAFLKEDACHFKSEMIANTFVLQEDEKIVAYFSLFNDIVSRDTADRNLWRKVRGLFPHAKHFSSYPAVKIGRLAVSRAMRSSGVGSRLINLIKQMAISNQPMSAVRFLTVDAYMQAVPFYERNGFKPLKNEAERGTLPMYYDLKQLDLSEQCNQLK